MAAKMKQKRILPEKGKLLMRVLINLDGSLVLGKQTKPLIASCVSFMYNPDICEMVHYDKFTDAFPFLFKYGPENINNTKLMGDILGKLIARLVASPIRIGELEMDFEPSFMCVDNSQAQKCGGTHKGGHRCGLCNVCLSDKFASGIFSQKVRNKLVPKTFYQIEFPENEKQSIKDSVLNVEDGGIPMTLEQATNAMNILMKEYKRSKILKGKKFSCTGHLGSPFKTAEIKQFLVQNGATYLEKDQKHGADFILTSFSGAKKHLEDRNSPLKNSNFVSIRFLFASFWEKNCSPDKYKLNLEIIKKYEDIPCVHLQDFTHNGQKYKPVFLESLYSELLKICGEEVGKKKYVDILKSCSLNTDNLHNIKGFLKSFTKTLIKKNWVDKKFLQEKVLKMSISKYKCSDWRNFACGVNKLLFPALTEEGRKHKQHIQQLFDVFCEIQFISYCKFSEVQKDRFWRTRLWVDCFLFSDMLKKVKKFSILFFNLLNLN